jgi:rhomboid protease GluP
MCPHCRAFITTSDRVCPYCDTPVGARAIDRRMPGDILGGLISHARFTTIMILVVNAGLYLATAIYSMDRGNADALMGLDGRTLFEFGAKYRDAILAGQWWRLVTAGFLHGGLMHILMNSWALFDLGTNVEQAYGTARMLVFYFLATVFGFFLSMLWNPGLSVGASAGVFGLIGAMIALGVRERSAFGEAMRGVYIRWALYGLVIGFLPGLAVDNAAHIGGLAAGFGTAFIAGTPRLVMNWKEQVWRAAAGISLALTALAFLMMVLWFQK